MCVGFGAWVVGHALLWDGRRKEGPSCLVIGDDDDEEVVFVGV